MIGLIGVIIRYPIKRHNSYFCSQFVAEVFKESGLNLWDLPSALVTPNDFLIHHSFEFVYEGKLYDYPLLNKALLKVFHQEKKLFYVKTFELLKKLRPQ